jgi:hypothetical protein
MTELLVDMLPEIRRKRRSERIVEAARLREGRLGQRHRRADDLVLEDQVLRPELAQARMVDQRRVRRRERRNEQVELRPEASARGLERRQ